MSHEALTEVLDTALERLRAGEALPAILAAEPEHAPALAPLLEAAAALTALRPVEEPAPEAQQADRARFLAVAALPGPPAPLRAPAPVRVHQRARQLLTHIIHRRAGGGQDRHAPGPAGMRNLAWFALGCVVVVGLTASALVVAQTSLPGNFLYPLKLAAEEIRLQLTAGSGARADFYLAQAQTRADEVEAIGQLGGVPEPAAVARMEASLEQALSLADELPYEQELDWLAHARRITEIEEGDLADAQLNAVDAAQPMLDRAHTAMTRTRQRVESRLSNPQHVIRE